MWRNKVWSTKDTLCLSVHGYIIYLLWFGFLVSLIQTGEMILILVLDLILTEENSVPYERQWALTADWLLRDTLCEVKGHDGCGLGQSTAWVFPERVGLCLARLVEIQRSLKGQTWTGIRFQKVHDFRNAGESQNRLKLEHKSRVLSCIFFYGFYFLIKTVLLHNENIIQLLGDYTGCKNWPLRKMNTEKFYLDHFIHGCDIKALTCSTRCSYPPQILTNVEKTKVIQYLYL